MSLYKFYLAEEHGALLDLVAARRNQSRAAVVRSALESYLPAALLADSASTKGGPSSKLGPPEGLDDVPVEPST
jgi:hypothetical protein